MYWWAQRTISLDLWIFYASSDLIAASTSGSICAKRNYIWGLEVLGAALGSPEFFCMKLNDRIGKIRILFEKLDYLDDPQCALGILRHCIGGPKMVYSLRCQTPKSPVIKSLIEFNAQQREELENILGTILPEEFWTQATLPITLSGLGVHQCQEQYKASYVGSVLSSEDLVSKITGESPKNCQVFQDLYSSIAKLDISNLSQKKIQHDLDKMAPKGSARFVKQEFLISMGIVPLRVMVEETQLQDMTGFKIK